MAYGGGGGSSENHSDKFQQERFLVSAQAAPFYVGGVRPRSELTAMMEGMMSDFSNAPSNDILQKGTPSEQLGSSARGSGSGPWAHPGPGGRFGGGYALDNSYAGQLGRSPRDPWGLPSGSTFSAPTSSAGSIAGQLPSDDELLGTSPAAS